MATQARGNPGTVIGLQFLGQPKALFVTGLIVLLMMLVPGFPAPVFALLGASLLLAAWYTDRQVLQGWIGGAPQDAHSTMPISLPTAASPRPAVVAASARQPRWRWRALRRNKASGGSATSWVFRCRRSTRANSRIAAGPVSIAAVGAPLLSGPLPTGTAALVEMLQRALRRSPSQFLGIRDQPYPGKNRRLLPGAGQGNHARLPTQRVVDVMRALIDEGVSIRNQRGILECLSERGLRENDGDADRTGATDAAAADFRPLCRPRQQPARHPGRTGHRRSVAQLWCR